MILNSKNQEKNLTDVTETENKTNITEVVEIKKKAITKTEVESQILVFFEKNKKLLTKVIEELDDVNGYLENSRYIEMELLNEYCRNLSPINIVFCSFYGFDTDNYYITSNGEKIYGPFNPNSYYFAFDENCALISSNSKDYSRFLDELLIDELVENRNCMTSIDCNEELSDLFDKLEKAT